MRQPAFPVPIGVYRSVDKPIFEERLHAQIASETKKKGDGDLDALFTAGETWVVE